MCSLLGISCTIICLEMHYMLATHSRLSHGPSPTFSYSSYSHQQGYSLWAFHLYSDHSTNGYDNQAELCIDIGLPSSLHLPLGAPSQGQGSLLCVFTQINKMGPRPRFTD